ncbi:lysoplasmalogenase [Corynebacterium anserum]|uniref:Lysoplasmalogenase n=1 Tax=Corynebacterium anserum TaxID=2684406 RepID=A0A7G7YMD1_9CORY|nr:lysoplasmalogenase [Corynebacterium anserum]QNH95651.1 lysoplasmalogenase [Corynebacterium anserum]
MVVGTLKIDADVLTSAPFNHYKNASHWLITLFFFAPGRVAVWWSAMNTHSTPNMHGTSHEHSSQNTHVTPDTHGSYDTQGTLSASTRLSLGVFVLVSVIHLINQLFSGEGLIDTVTQICLMAVLAVVLIAATRDLTPRPRVVTYTLISLFFSWLGDTVPRFLEGDASFMAMIGGFFVAQVFYAVAFWPYRGASLLRRPTFLLPYAGAAIVVVGVCWSGAGALLPAVIAYVLVILTMAILASGLGRIATLGGVLFLLSDSLIAFRSFTDATLPTHGFLVMLTYILGQGLLVWAVIRTAKDQS